MLRTFTFRRKRQSVMHQGSVMHHWNASRSQFRRSYTIGETDISDSTRTDLHVTFSNNTDPGTSGQQSSKPKKSPVKRPQSLPAEQKKDAPAATSSKVVGSHKQGEEETNLGDDKIVHLQATTEQKSDLEKNDENLELGPPPRKAMDFSAIVLQATRRSSLAPHGRRLSVPIEEDETSDRLSPTPSSAYSFSPHRRRQVVDAYAPKLSRTSPIGKCHFCRYLESS